MKRQTVTLGTHNGPDARLPFSAPLPASTCPMCSCPPKVDVDKLRAALRLCATWLECHRHLEANRKSDGAREALHAAREALR